MLKKSASIISTVFHPMVLSTILFALIIYEDFPINNKTHIEFFVSFFFTSVIVTLTVLFLIKQNKISDINASNRKERIIPLALGTIYFFIGFIILYFIESKPIIQGTMLCYLINTGIGCLITNKWKISMHAFGLGIPFIVLLLNGFKFSFIMIIVIIIVCISRLVLKVHTIAQILLGLGTSMLNTYYIMKSFYI